MQELHFPEISKMFSSPLIVMPPFVSITLRVLLVFSIFSLSTGETPALVETSEESGQKIRRGGPSTVVELSIPDKSTLDMSFPRLRFVNDSSEFSEEGSDKIASNGTMISGVAMKFGTRSKRAYTSTAHLVAAGGGHPFYNNKNYGQFNRFDNRRNNLESMDGSSGAGHSSSSWGGKWFNQLRRRTSQMMSPVMSYDRQQLYQTQGTAEEPEMAATYGGGGGGGYGHSGGGGGGYGKGVNKSAVGLLGFLSLLSLIQNVLNQTQPMGRRKRREISETYLMDPMGDNIEFPPDYDWNESVAEMTLLTPYLLPMITTFTYVQNGEIPPECSLQPICLANQVFVEKLGDTRGKTVGQNVSEKLAKSLQNTGWRRKSSEYDIAGKVIRAGMAGRNARPCRTIYTECTEFYGLPRFALTFPFK